MLTRLSALYREYPRTFWIILGASFVDRLGGALIFPFFALYITANYHAGMTQVGVLFSIIAITSVFGSLAGGAFTDKFGRKLIIILGLIFSAASTLLFAFAPNLRFIYLSGFIVGLFGRMAGPAHQAMIADVLPEHQRAEGFGLLRVAFNLAVAIGPAIGGLLAAKSYTLLFIIDVITSSLVAVFFFIAVPETKPAVSGQEDQQREETLLQSLSGYLAVTRDTLYMVFLFGSLLMVAAYMQMNSTLSVYLRDVHGVPDQGYGLILGINAGMVVLFQFWVTRRIKGLPPMITMVLGVLLYAVGFTMYGFVAGMLLFIAAMVIITIGEMLIAPIGQSLVAALSPTAMRGRYMAVYGFSWTIPNAFAPLLAGVIIDRYNPNWVWYGAGLVLLCSAAIFAGLHLKAGERIKHINSGQADPAVGPLLDRHPAAE